jgi:hypothetical protein
MPVGCDVGGIKFRKYDQIVVSTKVWSKERVYYTQMVLEAWNFELPSHGRFLLKNLQSSRCAPGLLVLVALARSHDGF